MGFKVGMSFTRPLVVTVMLSKGGTGLGDMSGRFEVFSAVKSKKNDWFRMFAFSTSSALVDQFLKGGSH